MSAERGRYRVVVMAFDMDGRNEGDWDDLRRAVDALETEYPGLHVLGQDETRTWPTVYVAEINGMEPSK